MTIEDASFGKTLAAAVEQGHAEGRGVLRRHERQAWLVAVISLGVMAGELIGGAWLNSLALQSDGLHSGTHAGVLLIAACAYRLARRRGSDARGVARTLDAAALVSGVLLGVAGFGIGVEAVLRLLHPEPVRFLEAALITALGLVVSGVSAALLRDAHAHAHAAEGDPHAHGRDLNLWAAYLHMVSDVVTSVLALGALLLGALTGWSQLDAVVGVLNAVVVAGFSLRLLRATSSELFRPT